MLRRGILLACFAVLAAAETGYFARQAAASLMRIKGERAFFRNDHQEAWRSYRKALRLGGDRDLVETDIVELLLFGLDQSDAGIKIDLPLPPERAAREALILIAGRLREMPRRAYRWSLASDVYARMAILERRRLTIDLAQLSEEPLENLLPEQWLSLDALKTASSLEPNNYIYPDLLAELFMEFGSAELAAPFCRDAVAAYPVLEGHKYLARSDIPAVIVTAALAGFDRAAAGESMIPRAAILCDAGRLLASHGDDGRALDYWQTVITLAPDLYDAHAQIGYARYRLKDYKGALESLRRATSLDPTQSWPFYSMGMAHRALGDPDAAVLDFRSARERAPTEVRFFHALGEVLEETGRIKEAGRQYLAAANLNSKDESAWSTLLAFSVRHDDARSASEACSRLIALNPGEGVYRDTCAALGQGAP